MGDELTVGVVPGDSKSLIPLVVEDRGVLNRGSPSSSKPSGASQRVERRPARPAPDELGAKLLDGHTLRVGGVDEEATEPGDVLTEAPERKVGPVGGPCRPRRRRSAPGSRCCPSS